MNENKGSLQSKTKTELERLKKIKKEYEPLKMEHELLKKASNIVRSKKRNLCIHRFSANKLSLENALSGL
ncbi:MAG: hypothetical protein HFP77_04755 [Methylococcales symbiont of Iophon sp. n. MRB-2018]|nr:MAG: hypothetical protein HFP77_04755 [Methylococcales symbiont of Iophon sp. n. MRB-2018]KAF3979944.1 MAG: hypothetical protein HFP76_04745 [Methylococcales symbiont of Iophon sp. n. MRB-2018]